MTIIMHLNLLIIARKPNDKKKKKIYGQMKREKKYKTIIYYTLHRNLMTEQHEKKKEHNTKGELMCYALTATLMQFVQKTIITHACVPGIVSS